MNNFYVVNQKGIVIRKRLTQNQAIQVVENFPDEGYEVFVWVDGVLKPLKRITKVA
jgi:hypothetical protein